MKIIKSIMLTIALAFDTFSATSSFAADLDEDLFQNPIIQEQVKKLEQSGWNIGDYQTVRLHTSSMGMGRNSSIVLLKVNVSGSRFLQTNHILAIFSAGSSGKHNFKKFLDPWTLAHRQTE